MEQRYRPALEAFLPLFSRVLEINATWEFTLNVSGRNHRAHGVGRDQWAAKVDQSRKVVTAFVLGTKRLFDFIYDNSSFEFRSVSYTNDPLSWRRTTGWSRSIQLFKGIYRTGVRGFDWNEAL